LIHLRPGYGGRGVESGLFVNRYDGLLILRVDSGLASQSSSGRLVRCRPFSVNADFVFSFTPTTGLNHGTCTFNTRRARQNFGSNRLNANGAAASVEASLWTFTDWLPNVENYCCRNGMTSLAT